MNKGFVSTLVLFLFLNLSIASMVLLTELESELRVLSAMQKVHREISWEARLIDEVNCMLQNNAEDLDALEEALWCERLSEERLLASDGSYEVILILDLEKKCVRQLELP